VRRAPIARVVIARVVSSLARAASPSRCVERERRRSGVASIRRQRWRHPRVDRPTAIVNCLPIRIGFRARARLDTHSTRRFAQTREKRCYT